jgi:AraC family transcriptional regulator, transcriptional activator of pobA
LAKITKAHFDKKLMYFIPEQIVIKAKRELFLTSKPAKEIAREQGYGYELEFSRFCKTNAGILPQLFRNQVVFSRVEA